MDSPNQWDLTEIVTLDSNILELEPWLSIWYYDINNFRSICKNLSELHSGLIPVNLTRNPMGFFQSTRPQTARPSRRCARPCRDLPRTWRPKRCAGSWPSGMARIQPRGEVLQKNHGRFAKGSKSCDRPWRMLVFFLWSGVKIKGACFFFQKLWEFSEGSMWVFPTIGLLQNGWFIMENPIKMDDLRGKPYYFWKHPYTHFGCGGASMNDSTAF